MVNSSGRWGWLWSWTEHVRSRRPLRHSVRLWRRRKVNAALVLLLLAAGVGYWWYFCNDQRVRELATAVLAEASGGEVRIERARLSVLEEIRITGLRVYLPDRPHSADNLVLAAEDVSLRHRPWSLLRRRLEVSRIVAYRPLLQVWYDRDHGITNLQMLRLSRTVALPEIPPTIELRDGTVTYGEISGGQRTGSARQRVDGRIGLDPRDPQRYRFELVAAAGSALPGSSVQGAYDLRTRRLETTGSFLLELIDLAQLPQQAARWGRLYELSDPHGQVLMESLYEPEQGYRLRVRVAQGRMRLPVPQTSIPLEDVAAELSCTPDQIVVERLAGRYEDYCRFEVQGVIKGYTEEAGFDLTLRMQGLNLPEDGWSAWRAGPAAEPNAAGAASSLPPPLGPLLALLGPEDRQQVAELAPTGGFDLEVHLQRSPGAAVQYRAVLQCRQAGLTYRGFPYPLRGVEGQVVFQPGRVTIGPLEAREGEQQVRIAAAWLADARQFDLTIEANRALLDERLRRALQPWQQELWATFSPSGLVNARYRLTEQDAEEHEELAVTLLNAGALYRDFPAPLSHLTGTWRYEQGRVAFDIARAEVERGGWAALAGEVWDLHSEAPSFVCDLRFADVLLDRKVLASLPGRLASLTEQVELTARAQGRARLSGRRPADRDPNRPAEAPVQYDIQTTLRDATVRYGKLPYVLTEGRGQVELSNELLRIDSFAGRCGAGEAKLAGWVRGPEEYRLSLEAGPLDVSADLAGALGPEAERAFRALQPAGRINLGLELSRGTTAGGAAAGSAENPVWAPRPVRAPVQYRAQVTVLDGSLAPTAWPGRLAGVRGSVIADPNAIRLTDLSSREGAREVRLSGVIRRRGTAGGLLHLTARQVELDQPAGQALSGSWGRWYGRLQPGGRLDAELDIRQPPPGASGAWQANGWAEVHAAGAHWPLALEGIEARWQGEATWDVPARRLQLAGSLAAAELLARRRPLRNVTAQLRFDSGPGEITLSEVAGVFCQGRVAGELKAALAQDPTSYELQLQLNDADLAEVLEAGKPPAAQPKNLKGRLTGWLNAGRLPAEAQRGTFLFVVRDALLGELPITAQLLHVLNLSLPREGAFNEASLTGSLVGQRVVFDLIELRGSAVALIGAGAMTLPDQTLDLVFAAESPHRLPQVPVITSFLQAISPGLAQVRVTGTFDQPKVEPVALPALEETLRELSPDLPRPAPQRLPGP